MHAACCMDTCMHTVELEQSPFSEPSKDRMSPNAGQLQLTITPSIGYCHMLQVIYSVCLHMCPIMYCI